MSVRRINRIIFCAFCIFVMQANPAVAYDSDQQKINSSIEILKSYGYQKNVDVLDGKNYTKKPVSIVFKNLADVDFTYAKFYAITATDNDGALYILINDDLKNSDARALACLILHESNHCKVKGSDSLAEEMMAHIQEVTLYIRILAEDESLKDKVNDRLVLRLNKLKKIYDDAIKAYITNNTSYVNYLKIQP